MIPAELVPVAVRIAIDLPVHLKAVLVVAPAINHVVAALAEDDIVIRSIGSPSALRISTGFYNTTGDIDRLIEALQAILDGELEIGELGD